jgi:hypothetical protein
LAGEGDLDDEVDCDGDVGPDGGDPVGLTSGERADTPTPGTGRTSPGVATGPRPTTRGTPAGARAEPADPANPACGTGRPGAT